MASNHVFICFLALVHYCCAAGVPMSEDSTTAMATSSSTLQRPAYLNTSLAALGNYSIYDRLPSLWFETCLDDEGHPPCVAYCHENDTICRAAGQFATSSCNEQWSTYNGDKLKTDNPEPGWTLYYTTYGTTGGLSTTTVKVYTTFSTANVSVVKDNIDSDADDPLVTITPVYAMGQPVQSVSVNTVTSSQLTNSWLTGPKPSCRYIALSTSNDCGQCSIYGGTVELFFWPPTSGTTTVLQSGAAPKSTILSNGMTLYSPSAYIYLSTIYASNSCTRVGQNHTGTFFAMDPVDVSTQVHWGGKVAQTGANHYGQLNYADLVGVPPVSDYENQPDCIMYGCSTIFPTYNPTLVVPVAMRTLRPEWVSCVAALEGLYDPPIALSEAAHAASVRFPSIPANAEPTTTSTSYSPSASQCSTPSAPTPPATEGPTTRSTTVPDMVHGLASIIANDGDYPATETLSIQASVLSGEPLTHSSSHAFQIGPVESGPANSQESNVKTTTYNSHHAINGLSTSLAVESPESKPSSEVIRASSQNLAISVSTAARSAASEGTDNMHYTYAPGTSVISTPWRSSVVEDPGGDYVVNGQTLEPVSPVVLTRSGTALTGHMSGAHDSTVELGTSTTVLQAAPDGTEAKASTMPPPSVIMSSTMPHSRSGLDAGAYGTVNGTQTLWSTAAASRDTSSAVTSSFAGGAYRSRVFAFELSGLAAFVAMMFGCI